MSELENKRFERVYGDIEVVCIDHNIIGEDRFFDDGDYDKFVKSLNELNEENEQLKKELIDANELNGIYVDFLVDKGFELSDVVEWSKRSMKND